MEAIRKEMASFNGRNNVTEITNPETNSVSYLTQSIPFAQEINNTGATIVDTYESETKHVLFLYNEDELEVGRYYLAKKLQGMSPDELAEKKSVLCIFESWNPEMVDKDGNKVGGWVPCVGLSSNQGPSKKAAHL